MTNFNVMLNTNDLKLGQSIAKNIRQRSGGLLGVQAMAFPHGETQVEVACNVDLFLFDEKNTAHVDALEQNQIINCYGNYFMTSFKYIQDVITMMATIKGTIHK